MSEQKALRYNEGKPQLSYILEFLPGIRELAKLCERGAIKYARGNWKKGLTYSGMVDSMMRHLSSFLNGEDHDPETGCHHMSAVAWGALAIICYSVWYGDKFDDRDKFHAKKEQEGPVQEPVRVSSSSAPVSPKD